MSSGITFSGAVPNTSEKWLNLLMMLGGVFVGWLVSPVTWLVAGPLRMISMMGAQAAQESGYNSTVCGDAGTSCGMLQFQLATIEALGGDDEDRSSPFWSGYYGVRMVRTALLNNPQWFLIAVPVYGFAVLRYLWTHGWGAASPWENAWAKKGIGGMTTDPSTGTSHSEPRAWGAFLIWRGLTLLPLGIAAYCCRDKTGMKRSKRSA
tara:strand:- start:55 stop:675 length:621 start_codon:yes stop_codon:yes gene_type:complete